VESFSLNIFQQMFSLWVIILPWVRNLFSGHTVSGHNIFKGYFYTIALSNNCEVGFCYMFLSSVVVFILVLTCNTVNV